MTTHQDPVREALEALVKEFPTDFDLNEAGWCREDIERARKAYFDACAALASTQVAPFTFAGRVIHTIELPGTIDGDAFERGVLRLCAPHQALQEAGGWRPIETAPKDGTEFLAWFEKRRLDEDDEITDEVIGGAWAIVSCRGKVWDEPEWLSAHGSYFMEDWCFAEEPICWAPLPASPTNEKGKT